MNPHSHTLSQTISYTTPHYKLIIVGNCGVGKTSLINYIMGKPFDSVYQSTIGVDVVSKLVKYNEKEIKVELHDTAGQEKYFSIVQNYLRNSDIAYICYDVSDVSSFDALSKWLNVVRDVCGSKIVTCVVGTKSDLVREVTKEHVDVFVEEHHLPYYEVSVKQREGVDKMFFSSVAMLDVFAEERTNKEAFVDELMNENKLTVTGGVNDTLFDIKREGGGMNVNGSGGSGGDKDSNRSKRKCICK